MAKRLPKAQVTLPDAPTSAPVDPQQIEMVSPNGERQWVREQHAGTLAALGYQQVTPEYEAQQAEKKKYGEGIVNELKAGALGLARGASFGFSDLAIKKGEDAGLLPEGSTESAQKLAEYNPDATTAGELASFAIPGLGELGALGKAGKAAGKVLGVGQKAVSTGGRVVGDVVQSVAKTIAGETVGNLAGSAAHLAAEAAVYQAAHNISEESLYDRDLTAEAVLAHTGQAAILGAGLGAALPASLMTGKALAEKVVDSTPFNWVASKAVKTVEKFFDPDRSAALYSGAMSKGELLRDTVKGQRFQSAVHELREGGFFKGGKVDLDLANAELVSVEKGALPSQQQAFERLQDLTEKAGNGMGDILKSADDAVLAAEAKPVTVWGDKDSAAFRDKIAGWQKTLQVTEAEAGRLNETLSEIEAGINASGGKLQDMHAIRRGLDARVGGKNWETLKGEEIELVKDIRRTLSTKIAERIEQLGEDGIVAKDAVTRWKRLNKLYGNLKSIEEPLDWQRARAEANVNVGGLRWRDLLATSIGASAFGPLGAVPGIVNRALQTEQGLLMRAAIGERVQQLGWAENVTRLTEKGIADGVKSFVHGIDAGTAGRAVLKKFGAPIAYASVERMTPAQRRQEQQAWFRETQDALVAIASDPQTYAEKQSEALAALGSAAPELRDGIVMNLVNANSYLLSVMPKSSADPLQPLKVQYAPPDHDVKRFRQVVQVVRQPLTVLDDLRRGTVNRDQTKAIQSLYPKLYDTMRQQVDTQINNPKAPKLTYSQRLRLGILFPGVEHTLRPEFIQAVNRYMGADEEPQQARGGGGRIRSTANLNLSEGVMTDIEKLTA